MSPRLLNCLMATVEPSPVVLREPPFASGAQERGEDVDDTNASQQHDAAHSERKLVVFLNKSVYLL